MMMTTAAIAMTTVTSGRKFDDIIRDAKDGDKLRCTKSTTRVDAEMFGVDFDNLFTVGETYTVKEGDFWSGTALTIADNNGREVPPQLGDRIDLNDEFELITDYPESKDDTVEPYTFDEAMDIAEEGDTLLCIKAVTGDAFFTLGKSYEVHMSDRGFSVGMLSILDNDGMPVPRLEMMPDRLDIEDKFIFI